MNDVRHFFKETGLPLKTVCDVLTKKTGKKVYMSYINRCLSGDADTLSGNSLRIMALEYCDAIQRATEEFLNR